MQKIDSKTVIIVLLVIINLYQFQSSFSVNNTSDVSNVFLKDKIESLNRDVSTVYVKLKLLDSIQMRLDNLRQDVKDIDIKLTESISR
tara:strand:- start:379 stop:642 length:264 start_codon:yes stop_codon:yes gene_type:complete